MCARKNRMKDTAVNESFPSFLTQEHIHTLCGARCKVIHWLWFVLKHISRWKFCCCKVYSRLNLEWKSFEEKNWDKFNEHVCKWCFPFEGSNTQKKCNYFSTSRMFVIHQHSKHLRRHTFAFSLYFTSTDDSHRKYHNVENFVSTENWCYEQILWIHVDTDVLFENCFNFCN